MILVIKLMLEIREKDGTSYDAKTHSENSKSQSSLLQGTRIGQVQDR